MAPGPQIIVAFNLIKGFPKVIQNIIGPLKKEIESMRDKLVLLSDMAQWAVILSSCSICDNDSFATTAQHEVNRRCATLLELYPGDPAAVQESLVRLDCVVLEMHTTFSDTSVRYEEFRMLYDGYLLHLEVDDRETVDKAFAQF
ncbi:hypothetical protein C8Q80DRAFT_1272350 [Daedaleopsis nitida]|nr:hypothetical protein C8Q80DRAFT_1272350 [Daedaleopsis nitida]